MRTNVIFRHPAEIVRLSDADGILAIDGAQWFVALLRRVPGLEIDPDLCQEDWGVVLYARRKQKQFWIGLSMWDTERAWLAHFHHGSTAWMQRLSSSGNSELRSLLSDVHGVLASESEVSAIVWYEENQLEKARPIGFPTPAEG
jgi:hypothetical protein